MYSKKFNDEGSNTIRMVVNRPLDSESVPRASIILYYKDDDNTKHFIMSVNREHLKQVGDFGGGRSSSDETWIGTSIREFNEESYGVVATLTDDDFSKPSTITMRSDKCVLSFVEIDQVFDVQVIKDLVRMMYRVNMKSRKSGDMWEIIDIEVFNEEELIEMIEGREVRGFKMWLMNRLMLKNHVAEIY